MSIQTSNREIITSIRVEYPDRDTLVHHINSPGEEGYRLYDILNILVPDLIDVNIINEVTRVEPDDTVIRWRFIQE